MVHVRALTLAAPLDSKPPSEVSYVQLSDFLSLAAPEPAGMPSPRQPTRGESHGSWTLIKPLSSWDVGEGRARLPPPGPASLAYPRSLGKMGSGVGAASIAALRSAARLARAEDGLASSRLPSAVLFHLEARDSSNAEPPPLPPPSP